MGPISLWDFKQLVQEHECSIVRTRKEWAVVNSKGHVVSRFAITHGKRTRGNEVKATYVKIFLQRVKEGATDE